MSEFCPDCFEKINGFSCENYVISKDWDICEGCGEFKRVVVCRKSYSGFDWLDFSAEKSQTPKKTSVLKTLPEQKNPSKYINTCFERLCYMFASQT